MKFTSGPWSVIDRHKTLKGTPDNQIARFWIGHGETEWRGPSQVCSIDCMVSSMVKEGERQPYDYEAEANARLIASSPELFAIVVAFYENRNLIKADEPFAGALEKLMEQAKQVIEKAEG